MTAIQLRNTCSVSDLTGMDLTASHSDFLYLSVGVVALYFMICSLGCDVGLCVRPVYVVTGQAGRCSTVNNFHRPITL